MKLGWAKKSFFMKTRYLFATRYKTTKCLTVESQEDIHKIIKFKRRAIEEFTSIAFSYRTWIPACHAVALGEGGLKDCRNDGQKRYTSKATLRPANRLRIKEGKHRGLPLHKSRMIDF